MRLTTFARPLTAAIFLLVAAGSLAAQQAAPSVAEYQGQSAQTFPATPDTRQQGAGTPSATMPPAPPADQVDPVRLSDVEGQVRLFDNSAAGGAGKLFEQVRLNMAMLPGMRIETGNDGRAELQFPDGSIARVAPNSALVLVSIVRENETRARITLKPVKGLTYYELPQSMSSYSIQVGPFSASAGVVSTAESNLPSILRVSLDSTPYEAAVLRGAIHFEDAGRNVSYDVDANQTAKIDPGSASAYDVQLVVAGDTWDAWNTDRDGVLAQVASTQPAGDAPGGPGWSDLDYYGSWYNIPGEGMAWAPDGVDQNFDPYGAGAWSYYTNTGYSWTSAYPWGWLPYHCGGWSYYNHYGWMWLPANCGWGYGRGWYPYAEASGLNGYRLPLRPVPARGLVHLPPSQAVLQVRRGTPVRFRAMGEPRPAPRSLNIAGEALQPQPAQARPAYSTGSGAGTGFVGSPQGGGPGYVGAYRTSQGNPGARVNQGSGLQPGRPGYGSTMHIITPATGLHYVPSPAPAPAPRMSLPAAPARSFTPAPAAPAPHISAPASAPASPHH